MTQSRPFRGGAAIALVGFAALATLGPARQPGKGKKLPEAVQLKADVPYAGTDNPRQRLDLLLPKTPKGERPLPVIVYIHGGAWLAGSRTGGHGRLAGYVAG